MFRQKHKAPLSIKSPEPRTKGNVDIRGGNYSKGLNKQDVNLTDRLLASSVWHSPEHTPEANKERVQKLGVIQNGCLRMVLGAYRATPMQVLEAEAEVPSI